MKPDIGFTACFAVLFLMGLFFLSGCAPLRPVTDSAMDKKAFDLCTTAQKVNAHIKTSKGTGWIAIKTKETAQTFRIVWAAALPDRIRMTLLLSGLPVETMIATGHCLIFVSHTGRHQIHTIHSKDPDLKKYLNLGVKLSDIISVLLGRLPVTSFDDAYYLPDDPLFHTIVLSNAFDGQRQHLHFDNDMNIDRISRTNTRGQHLYEIRLGDCLSRDFGRLCTKIEVRDKTGRELTMMITKFAANPEIKASAFVLTEPG